MSSRSNRDKKKNAAQNTQEKPPKESHAADTEMNLASASVRPDGPKPIHHCEITCKKQESKWDRAKRIMETVGIVLILIYTFATILIFIENQRAATAAERQTRVDQRPWLEFRFGDATSGDSGNVTIKIGAQNPISVPGQLLNFGKTPALDIKGVTVLQVVAMGKDPDLPDRHTDIALTALGEAVPKGEVSKGVMDGNVFEEAPIFPGRHSQFDVFRVKPSKERGFVEPLVLSDEEYAALINKTAYIAVWGEVRYDDIFGVSHWTRFCNTQGAGFVVSNEKCVNYSDVDKNMDPWEADHWFGLRENCP